MKTKLQNIFEGIGIKQQRQFWCLPACLETILKFYSIHDIDQNKIVENYLLHPNSPEDVSNLRNKYFQPGAYHRALSERWEEVDAIPEFNFRHGFELVNFMLKERREDIRFCRISTDEGGTTHLIMQEIENLLTNGIPVIIPITIKINGKDYPHILIAIELKSSEVLCFDPARNKPMLVEISKSTVLKNAYEIVFAKSLTGESTN